VLPSQKPWTASLWRPVESKLPYHTLGPFCCDINYYFDEPTFRPFFVKCRDQIICIECCHFFKSCLCTLFLLLSNWLLCSSGRSIHLGIIILFLSGNILLKFKPQLPSLKLITSMPKGCWDVCVIGKSNGVNETESSFISGTAEARLGIRTAIYIFPGSPTWVGTVATLRDKPSYRK
jgi:hypothetical protein